MSQRSPDPHARFQVSTAGGSYPKWREDGKELLYFDADYNVAAASIVTHADTVKLGTPHMLFRITGISTGYPLVAKDKGQEFLVAHYPGLLSSNLILVTNWDLERKR